jgi:hypothetical protein
MDRPVTIALVVAAVLVTQPGLPGPMVLGTLAAIAVALLLSVRWRVAPLATAVLLVAGVALRASVQVHAGSDVLDVTAAAIREALAGGNPYGIGYGVSRPPGAPFPYGPLALLWYAPVQANGWQLELVVSCVVVTLLALRGRLLGLAIYAFAPTLIATASDGSNDTSVGLVLLATFVVARRRPVIGAALLAVAVALKPYAAAWAPAFLVWGGWPVIATFVGASLVLWSPVILAWGIGSFLRSLDMANAVHSRPYWSLGAAYEALTHIRAPRAALDGARIVLGTAAAIATLRWARASEPAPSGTDAQPSGTDAQPSGTDAQPSGSGAEAPDPGRSLDGVILAGTLVYLVTLFGGYWGTYAYFGAIAPILCWRIDDWLGLPSRPLAALSTGPRDGAPEEAVPTATAPRS